MISLALQILFGSGFSVGVKAAAARNNDMIWVGGVNYIAAALLATVWTALRYDLHTGAPGALYGSLNGIGYFSAYFFLLKGIRHQGLAATRAVGGLATLLPVAASMLAWGERPSAAQAAGCSVAVLSAVLLDSRKNMLGDVVRGMWVQMLIFFTLSGGSRVAAKAFAEANVPNQKLFYVWVVFASSGALSALMLAASKRKPRAEELLWGTAIGACNMLQVAYMLRALEQIAGIVAFPTAAAGGLILTSAAAAALGERPPTRVWYGVAAAAAAVFLLNWTSG